MVRVGGGRWCLIGRVGVGSGALGGAEMVDVGEDFNGLCTSCNFTRLMLTAS
jgi:hypothetical protein